MGVALSALLGLALALPAVAQPPPTVPLTDYRDLFVGVASDADATLLEVPAGKSFCLTDVTFLRYSMSNSVPSEPIPPIVTLQRASHKPAPFDFSAILHSYVRMGQNVTAEFRTPPVIKGPDKILVRFHPGNEVLFVHAEGYFK